MRDPFNPDAGSLREELLREKSSDDDHFYGAWKSGGKVAGGTMARAKARDRRERRERAASGLQGLRNPDGSRVQQPQQAPAVDPNDLDGNINQLMTEAQSTEAQVTPVLQSIAADTGGRMEGLQHRLKEKESLTRKVKADMEEKGMNAAEATANINDHVRYTMVAAGPEAYAEQYTRAAQALQAQGYQPLKPPKDFWARGVPPPPVYQGVNAVYVNPQTGQRFELQFHTPGSLAAKHKTHPHFATWRTTKDPAVRFKELQAMEQIQMEVPQPSGWPPSGTEFRWVHAN